MKKVENLCFGGKKLVAEGKFPGTPHTFLYFLNFGQYARIIYFKIVILKKNPKRELCVCGWQVDRYEQSKDNGPGTEGHQSQSNRQNWVTLPLV